MLHADSPLPHRPLTPRLCTILGTGFFSVLVLDKYSFNVDNPQVLAFLGPFGVALLLFILVLTTHGAMTRR